MTWGVGFLFWGLAMFGVTWGWSLGLDKFGVLLGYFALLC